MFRPAPPVRLTPAWAQNRPSADGTRFDLVSPRSDQQSPLATIHPDRIRSQGTVAQSPPLLRSSTPPGSSGFLGSNGCPRSSSLTAARTVPGALLPVASLDSQDRSRPRREGWGEGGRRQDSRRCRRTPFPVPLLAIFPHSPTSRSRAPRRITRRHQGNGATRSP
jgi:hypothetical protein